MGNDLSACNECQLKVQMVSSCLREVFHLSFFFSVTTRYAVKITCENYMFKLVKKLIFKTKSGKMTII